MNPTKSGVIIEANHLGLMDSPTEDLGRPMLSGHSNKPHGYSANPYQSLVRPMPSHNRVRTESRLSSVSSYQDVPEIRIRLLQLWIGLQVLAGIGSILSAALLIPFGARHSDVIHSISFMFGLAYITSAVSAAVSSRWKANTSVKVCLIISAFTIIIAVICLILGVLSLCGVFEGKGAIRVPLRSGHHDIATHALTGLSMASAILEIAAATVIVVGILKAMNAASEERMLPVRV